MRRQGGQDSPPHRDGLTPAPPVPTIATPSHCPFRRSPLRPTPPAVPKKPATKRQQTAPIDSVRKKLAGQVRRRLKADYPGAACALEHGSPEQLLVATILSAQCTDARVNLVTRELFAEYPDAESLARAPLRTLERLVASTGFFRNKAKNIKACCATLVQEHGGRVPRDLQACTRLAGVGRKTANVVLGVAYGMATGVVVDTHVGRLSRRTGLTDQTDPVKVERDLIGLLPRREWVDFSHRMIYHGRRVCGARKPNCGGCSMSRFCPRVGVA